MSIELTKAAVGAVNSALGARGKGIGIRLVVEVVSVRKHGFRLEFVDEVEETDICFEQDGVRLYVTKDQLSYAEGVLIDYTDDPNEIGFMISHATPCRECGCK